MDRFAANTLRTLGIVLISIFVILGCLILLAIALCFGALANSGSPSDRSSASGVAVGAFLAAIVLITIGIVVITRLAKGMVSASSAPPPQRYTLLPPPVANPVPPAPLLSDEAKLDQALASLEAKVRSPEPPPHVAPTEKAAPPKAKPLADVPLVHSKREVAPARRVDIDHLFPASRTVIRQLAYAIVAKVAAEVALGIVGWFGALGVPRFVRVPFPVYRFGFIAWGLAAIAPHLVLLFALARRPGPRAFAYALVIPSLHLLFGIFGHSAFLAFILRAGQATAPLLSIAPWLLDILILYLAWKAIRQTGIEPNPARLIMASVVIFLYTSFLPVFLVILNQWNWM